MKLTMVILLAAAFSVSAAAQKHELVYARDGSGVFGYKDTPKEPWSGYVVHDPDRPLPKRVDAVPGRAPSDAIVLFDGKDLSRWKPNVWKLGPGWVEATTGVFETRDEYGSCQLHIEWRAPVEPTENIMNRGNNGVRLMGLFEIQIFDSYRTPIYPDGQAASIYGQTPPLVNVCRKPGEWEVFDIIFLAPEFRGETLDKPARVTVLHNGVVVQHDERIHGVTAHAALPGPYPAGRIKGPLALSGHNCPVRFRNIWLRPL